MSDLQTLRAMLDRAGIVYRLEEDRHDRSLVVIEQGTGPKNTGYVGFVTWAHFDDDGNLVEWSSWE